MNKYLHSVITIFIGAAIGLLFQQWSDRSKPEVFISGLSFDEVRPEEIGVEIPLDLQELSRSSSWFNTLDDSDSIENLVEMLESDLTETVEALEELVSYLPALKSYLEKNETDQSAQAQIDYQRYIAESPGTSLFWTYLTLNTIGLLKRAEVEIDVVKIQGGRNNGPLAAQIFRDRLDAAQAADELSQLEIIAVEVVTGWHPTELLKVLDVIEGRVGEQVVINRRIRDQLEELVRQQINSTAKDFLTIDVVLSNRGSKTIAFDDYGVLSLSGHGEPIFVEMVNEEHGVSIDQGSAERVSLRSRNPLSADLSKKLRALYNTEFIKCVLTTKLLTPTRFSSEWVSSLPVNLSNFNEKVERDFVENAVILSL